MQYIKPLNLRKGRQIHIQPIPACRYASGPTGSCNFVWTQLWKKECKNSTIPYFITCFSFSYSKISQNYSIIDCFV